MAEKETIYLGVTAQSKDSTLPYCRSTGSAFWQTEVHVISSYAGMGKQIEVHMSKYKI